MDVALSLAEANSRGIFDWLVMDLDRHVWSSNPTANTRIHNAFTDAKYKWTWQILKEPESRLLKAKNFGRTSLRRVSEGVRRLGLGLEMKFAPDLAEAIAERCGGQRPEPTPLPVVRTQEPVVPKMGTCEDMLGRMRDELPRRRNKINGWIGDLELIQRLSSRGVIGISVLPCTPAVVRDAIEQYAAARRTEIFDETIERLRGQLAVIDAAMNPGSSGKSPLSLVVDAASLLDD
jgi:hypothetical protein